MRVDLHTGEFTLDPGEVERFLRVLAGLGAFTAMPAAVSPGVQMAAASRPNAESGEVRHEQSALDQLGHREQATAAVSEVR